MISTEGGHGGPPLQYVLNFAETASCDWTPMCASVAKTRDGSPQITPANVARLASLPNPAGAGQYFMRKIRVVDS